MFRKASDFHGYALHTPDGDIGHIEDFYFDDEEWRVRYVVVNTGGFLSQKRVLVSPLAFDGDSCEGRKIRVLLSREQIENSPAADLHQPLTRRWEREFHSYYDWPVYWALAPLGGVAAYPSVLHHAEEEGEAEELAQEKQLGLDEISGEDSHLQSMNDVCGFGVEASDGRIGHVSDFVLGDGWTIQYLKIQTGSWWPGKKVLLPPALIRKVSWADDCIELKIPCDAARGAPPAQMPLSAEMRAALDDYYARYNS